MRGTIVLAAACVLLGTPALAQPNAYTPNSERMERRDIGTDRDMRGRRDSDDERGGFWDDDGPGRGWRGGMYHGGWLMGGGAHFVFRSGDTRLGVKCDPQEPMRACVEAAVTLMERARSIAAQTPPAPPPASPPGPGAR